MTIDVHGLTEAQRRLIQVAADLSGDPLREVIRSAAGEVVNQARANAPVDTGALRNSLTAEARTAGADGGAVEGVVGSSLAYAPAVEYGSPPHDVPLAALEGWAERHGANVYVVARAIARRGTRARGFLSRAIDASRGHIEQIVAEGIARIVGN